MATLSKGYTFGATEEVTAAKLHALVDDGSVSSIETANISDSAITDAKIASVSGAKFVTLANIPAGAGAIPAANLSAACLLTGNQTVAGVKTFSSFTVTPSSAPTTDYQTANKKYVDDTISSNVGLGAWASKSNNTVYQAATDGFVVVSLLGSSAGGDRNYSESVGYTDGSNPPTTVKGYAGVNYCPSTSDLIKQNSYSFPVKSGDYYKVVLTQNHSGGTCSTTQTITWIPMGA